MRIRLLAFGLLAFCQLHFQQNGVLGQKYYMNFAFNNNNPDGGTSDGNGGANPAVPNAIEAGHHEDSHDHSGGHGNALSPNNNSDEMDDNDKSSHDDDNESHDEHISDRKDHTDEEPSNEENRGTDDDDNDSDSKDPPGRREKEREQERENGQQPGDHSHHSSYEISIDDSFGGRYVRSIYESSESHGHSGSNGGSGSGDKPNHESSESARAANNGNEEDNPNGNDPKGGATKKTYGENDYEEYN